MAVSAIPPGRPQRSFCAGMGRTVRSFAQKPLGLKIGVVLAALLKRPKRSPFRLLWRPVCRARGWRRTRDRCFASRYSKRARARPGAFGKRRNGGARSMRRSIFRRDYVTDRRLPGGCERRRLWVESFHWRKPEI